MSQIDRDARDPNPPRADDMYRDGPLYDRIFPGPSASGLFLAAQAKKTGAPILELACGTGILTLPLAARGYQITGLDNSPEMLAYARHKEASRSDTETNPVSWIQADMRDFELATRFKLIFLVHNSVCHLHTRADFQACMQCVRRHLAPGGRFIVNTFMPDPQLLRHAPSVRQPYRRYRDPQTGREVLLLQENEYDPELQIRTSRIYRQIPGKPIQKLGELRLRIHFPPEFDALLQWCGFTITRKFGNYQGAPFGTRPDQATQTQLCVCAANP